MKKKLFVMDKLLVSMSGLFMCASFFIANRCSILFWGEPNCPKSLQK